MALAREKFLALLKEINKLNEKGIRIRMIGEISLLPMSVRQPAAELELKTKNNSNYILNICLAYTRNISYTSDSVPGLSLNMVPYVHSNVTQKRGYLFVPQDRF